MPDEQAIRVDPTRGGELRLEGHVDESFRTAWALAHGAAMDAARAIVAGLIVAERSQSTAFEKLKSLFSGLSLPEPPVSEELARADLGALAMSAPLAEAYSIAEPFLRESQKNVWGRDYVSFVLLSGDPSLQELAAQVGATPEALQDEWFRFVTSDEGHREPEDWKRWWRSAGVPLPDERAGEAGERTSTLLFTWNPGRFSFSKMEEAARTVAEEGQATLGWSTGQRKANVAVGDRVFLMRQGQEPRGLVGSGIVGGSPEELPHWEEKARAEGKTYHRVPVRWDVLREEPVLPLPELIDRFGRKDLWETQAGGRELEPELASRLEEAWRESRGPEPRQPYVEAPIPWVDSDAIPVIGDVTAYRPSEHDSLGARTQAEIFATLLIARDVRPPLALALLGDWGVGKTFFMRLMQENVAAVTGKGARTDSSSGSVSRAAQIEFNAWHYVDSDLWASLASHIFDVLSKELCDPGEKLGEVRRLLRRRIHSSRKEQGQALTAIAEAEKQRKAAAEQLAQRRTERERAAADYTARRLERVWQAVLRVRPDPGQPDQANWPDLNDLKERAERTARRLGLSQTIESAEDAERVYRELCRLSRRGASLATAFAAAFSGSRAWLSGSLLLIVLAAVVAWPWMLQQIEDLLHIPARPGTDRLLEWVLRLGTLVAAAVTWAGRSLSSISSAMSYLERIRAEIKQPRVPLEPAGEEEKKLRKDLEDIDAVVAREEQRIEEAGRQISEAQAEIQRINAGGLVYDFLDGKVRDSRYRDRLGLISVIRNDFEQLGALLRDWRKFGNGDASGQEAIPNAAADPRPIERIILYIDDLDRCPPKRVVEVLQAVHLILAFDLFVVVVAVDARWLERSLNEAYNSRGWIQDGSPPTEPVHRFSAHNYLEKIFQIPYSLPRMSEAGYRQLVANLTVPSAALAIRPRYRELEEKQDEDRGEGENVRSGARESQEDSMRAEVIEERARTDDPAERTGEEEGRKQEDDALRQRKQAESRRLRQEEAERRIAAMGLEQWEEKVVASLYPFIGTPRLAKRCVNVYRLLRVLASLEKDEDGYRVRKFSFFIDREKGEYRAALALVAISIGRADVAPEILEDLHDAKGKTLGHWLLHGYGEMIERLARANPGRANAHERRLRELNAAAVQIHSDLGKVAIALQELGAAPLDDNLDVYRKWAKRVGRYSFGWHPRPDSRAPEPVLAEPPA